MKSAKILLAVGLLVAGAGMALPSAASAASPAALPSAGPIGGLLATLQTPAGAGEFGHSVAVSGNTAAVGAPFTPVRSDIEAGAVYIYTKASTGWRKRPTITLDDPPAMGTTTSVHRWPFRATPSLSAPPAYLCHQGAMAPSTSIPRGRGAGRRHRP